MHPAKSLRVIVAIVALAPALGAQTSSARQPIARIGDQAIYDEDLFPSIGAQLWQFKNQEYDLKSKALVDLVNRRLVEAEAKSKGAASADVFLQQTVDPSVPAPSAGEIEAYYLAQKDRINRPLSEVRAQLEQAFMQARRQQARQSYIDGLRLKAGVSILLDRPRMEVTVDPSRVRGNPDAPVTIVEFADFQCPYCLAVQPAIKQVMDKYQGKVRLAFRDFPLRQIHPRAQQSAEAAHCAGDQGKFWEYHDLLYSNQSKLDLNSFMERAVTAGLDTEQFQACLDSGKFRAQIDSDLQSGSIAGVTGTPAFYINGVPLTGAQPLSEFEKIIDSVLAGTPALTVR